MFIVQVGAHGHEDTAYRNSVDLVPAMIAKGASALLIEPQPHYARILSEKYANNTAVRVINQAVCGHMVRNATLYSVNLNNQSSFGTPYADGRCANKSISPDTKSDWITEIASLNKQQVLNQAYLFSFSPQQCLACSKALGHYLPKNCMRDIVTRNLRETAVPCVRWESVLPIGRPISLLMIDAEGHESHIIGGFPFKTYPVDTIKFEAKHLSRRALGHTTERLTREGYVLNETGDDQHWVHQP